MTDSSRLLILGRGRLGKSIQAASEAAGLPVSIRPSREPLPPDALAGVELVLLAVPDWAVPETAAALAAQLGAPAGTGFAHLSGALGLEALSALGERGHPVGSWHPFQPFAHERPPSAFEGATIGIDADSDRLRERLETLARRLGALPKHVPDRGDDRALYHAAAVVASTYVVALAAQAQALLTAIGWEEEAALAAVLPLMQGTVEALGAKGLPEALSGPLRRGEVETVARHLGALDRLPDSEDLDRTYRALGVVATALAVGTGLDQDRAAQIVSLLEAEG